MKNLVYLLKFYLKRTKEGYAWKCFTFFPTLHGYILEAILFSKALRLLWAFRNCLSNTGSNHLCPISLRFETVTYYTAQHFCTFFNFLMTNEAEHLPICLLTIWIFSCGMSGSCVLHIFLLEIFYFSYLFMAIPLYSGYQSFVRDMYFKCILLPSYPLSLWHQYN